MDQHQQTPTNSVLIPALQSVVTGLFIGLLVLVLGLVLRWHQPWRYGLLATTVAALLSWFSLLGRWLFWIETLLGVDLNRDQVVGLPPPKSERVQIALIEDNGRRGVYLDLPIDEQRLVTFAKGLMNGKKLNESSWIGRTGIFSRAEYSALRDELISRGLARWINPWAHNQGVELSPGGKALVRYYAELEGTPPFSVDENYHATHSRDR